MTLQQDSDHYQGYRTAGIRMREDLLPSLQFHRTDKLFDTIAAIHAFDKAHTVMLVEQGIIPAEAGAAILSSLRHIEGDDGKARLEANGGKHSGEQYLIRTLGEDVGGWINTARSSGDLGQVGRYLTIRNHLLNIMPEILGFRGILIELAPRFDEVVYPGQTYLQHGQPTTIGHWLSMWASVFERDYARFTELYQRANRSPAGAGILTGSDFDVDRDRVAELLGFPEPIPHTMDAILSQDVLLETVSVMALFWADLARLADDLDLWLSTEYQYVDFPDRFCDTSSIMPQKRNPSVPQQIKSQMAKAIGNVTTGYVGERGSSGENMNARYETERILWESFGAVRALLHDVGLMLKAMEPQTDRLLAGAGEHWACATDLAGLIVKRCQLPWRTAHQIVAITVRLAEERGQHPDDVDATLVDEAAQLYFSQDLTLATEEIREALDPAAGVARRTLVGGPSARAHAPTVNSLRQRLSDDETELAPRLRQAERGAHVLEAAIDRIIGESAT